MPELPEVETIRRNLAPHVEGRTLERLEVLDARWCRPLPGEEIAAALEGRVVERLDRVGKYLIWAMEDDVHLFVHLRMTGTLLVDPPEVSKHTRVRFGLGDREVLFVDPRRFGTGELALGTEERDAFLAARLGIEPLDAAFTPDHLVGLARNCRAPVKAFLLDQKRIAGVGNIYADEALFRARIHPLRRTNTLTRRQLTVLHATVIDSLHAGIESKGATIDDFRDPYGVQGSFQDQFLIHLREGLPCVNCGRAVTKLRAAGRGTYVCTRCQPVPRAAKA
jgi:formamidopyrimidine-DNA glycosylase